jgi:hypothetical protein
MKRRRRTEAASHNHSLTVAKTVMAWGAKDIVLLLALFQDFPRDWKRKCLHQRSTQFTRVEMFICSELPTRNRARHAWPR